MTRKQAMELADQLARAVNDRLRQQALEHSQQIGLIKLRLRALERIAGQNRSVDDLVEEELERADAKRIAGELAGKRAA
jgi:hypothetical protein